MASVAVGVRSVRAMGGRMGWSSTSGDKWVGDGEGHVPDIVPVSLSDAWWCGPRMGKDGHGKPRHIHFLRPDRQEAYRARHGRYPDRRGRAGRVHADAVAEVVEAFGVERKPH